MRKTNRWLLITIVALSLLGIRSGMAQAQSQRLADPSYFYPGVLWTKLEAATPTAGLAIINPASGSGDKLDPNYASQVKEAKAHGLIVLGYVDTAYTKRPLGEVQADAGRYFKWYHVSGIFYDEVTNTDSGLSYYKQVYGATKQANSDALVVLNPGTMVPESYMKVGDIICTFESPYNVYQTQYVSAGWVKQYPANRFWHIVLDVPTVADMRAVVRETRARHAGWVYITPAKENPNPYDSLPPDPYWQDLLSALANPE